MRFVSRAQQAAVMAQLTARKGVAATGRVLRNPKTYKYGGLGALGITAAHKSQPNPYGDPSERRIAPLVARYALGALATVHAGKLAHKAAVRITGKIRAIAKEGHFSRLSSEARAIQDSYIRNVRGIEKTVDKAGRVITTQVKAPVIDAGKLAEHLQARNTALAPIKKEFDLRRQTYWGHVGSKKLAHGYSAAGSIAGHYVIPAIGARHTYKRYKAKRKAQKARIQTAQNIRTQYNGI